MRLRGPSQRSRLGLLLKMSVAEEMAVLCRCLRARLLRGLPPAPSPAELHAAANAGREGRPV